MLAFVWKPAAIGRLSRTAYLSLSVSNKQTRIDLADGAYPAVFQVPKVPACGCHGLTTVAPRAISLLSF